VALKHFVVKYLLTSPSIEWWKKDIEEKYKSISLAGRSFGHVNITGGSLIIIQEPVPQENQGMIALNRIIIYTELRVPFSARKHIKFIRPQEERYVVVPFQSFCGSSELPGYQV